MREKMGDLFMYEREWCMYERECVRVYMRE